MTRRILHFPFYIFHLSDGDGLDDREEVDCVCEVGVNDWHVISGPTTVFARPPAGTTIDDDIRTVTLPSPVTLGGVVYDRASIDVNGKVHLIPVDGQTVLTRECPVHFPERKANVVWFRPTTNATCPGPARKYEMVGGEFWYCEIMFVDFEKPEGIITSTPSEQGEMYSWSGQYKDEVTEEEEFHLKQFRGEVPLPQGGLGDCFTIRGLKYYIAQQAITKHYVVTNTWIVKGNTADEARTRCESVIQEAVAKEIEKSNQIIDLDLGFSELKAKEHVNYNAAFRYHCTYLGEFVVSPTNNVHPAYAGEVQ